MKFDYIIGNPPYNDDFDQSGDNGNFGKPVYHLFLDESYKVGEKVMMIHPARFLFNAGATPKEWNSKMLSDSHLQIPFYEPLASNVFPNVGFKGGVVVSYRDSVKKNNPIGIFIPFEELKSISNKVWSTEKSSLSEMVFTQIRFNLNELYTDYPEYKRCIGSDGKDKRLRNNAFTRVPVFSENRVNEDDIEVHGLIKNKRVTRFVKNKYIDMNHENLCSFKVLVPRANGTGALGEALSTPIIGYPLIGYTQSYIGIGKFKTQIEAENLLKYIKSKFCRVMLGILKITQDNERETWRKVPLQDFTPNSDIDWTKPIPEIDQQLYKKYGLSEEEIEFIETHVKEME